MGELNKFWDINAEEVKGYSNFTYLKEITKRLDAYGDTDFDDKMIFEIVLWKINRYPVIDDKLLVEINKLKNTKPEEYKECEKVLRLMLDTKRKGFGLPMASAVLRFRNPLVFPIIDQRAYRVIMDDKLKVYYSTPIDKQITIYFDYIKKCRKISNQFNIEFSMIDRVLYMFDKDKNQSMKLDR